MDPKNRKNKITLFVRQGGKKNDKININNNQIFQPMKTIVLEMLVVVIVVVVVVAIKQCC